MKISKTKQKLLGLFLLTAFLLTQAGVRSLVYGKSAAPLNPVYNDDGSVTWENVFFGSYPQTEITGSKLTPDITEASYDNNGDAWVGGTKYRRISVSDTNNSVYFGKNEYRYFKWERIPWRVLDNDGSTLLLMAKMGIDCKKYNQKDASVTWAGCSLRTWLNQIFYNTAFVNAEQKAVEVQTVDNSAYGDANTRDSVSLLSIDDMQQESYGFAFPLEEKISMRQIAPSNYANAMGAYYGDYDAGDEGAQYCWWWLRSPGVDENGSESVLNYARLVDNDGTCGYHGRVDNDMTAVVPVIRVKLTSDLWYRTNDGTSGEGGDEAPVQKLAVSDPIDCAVQGDEDYVQFQVTAKGGNSSVYTYQWFYAPSRTAAGSRLEEDSIFTGCNGSKLNIAIGTSGNVTLDGYYYCVICDGRYTIESKRANLSIKKAEQEITYYSGKIQKGKVEYGEQFSLNALSSGNGKISYKSSNSKVLSVNASGMVKAKKYGKASITIKAAATGIYPSASKKVSLTVIPKKVRITKVNCEKMDGKIAGIYMQWSTDPSVSGYQYSIAYNKQFTDGMVSRWNKNNLTLRSIDTGKSRIYMRVRAYKMVGNKPYYGKWSHVYSQKLQ